jgi:hypothetical protein
MKTKYTDRSFVRLGEKWEIFIDNRELFPIVFFSKGIINVVYIFLRSVKTSCVITNCQHQRHSERSINRLIFGVIIPTLISYKVGVVKTSSDLINGANILVVSPVC